MPIACLRLTRRPVASTTRHVARSRRAASAAVEDGVELHHDRRHLYHQRRTKRGQRRGFVMLQETTAMSRESTEEAAVAGDEPEPSDAPPPPSPLLATADATPTSEQVSLSATAAIEGVTAASTTTTCSSFTSSSIYRPDVDGLRAIAVLGVVCYHLDHRWLPGGFTGVDIFFVISGYVVSGSLLRARAAAPSIRAFLWHFYGRRAKRLTPALLAMLGLSSTATSLLLPPYTRRLREYYRTAQLAAVGCSNNYFISLLGNKGDYFDEGEAALEYNPFTHTWSLGVEEQFYLIVPLLTALAYGRHAVERPPPPPPPQQQQQQHGRKHGRRSCEAATTAAPAVRCCASDGAATVFSPRVMHGVGPAISLALSTALSLASGTRLAAFYSLPSRYWQLTAGALISHAEIFSPLSTSPLPTSPLAHGARIPAKGRRRQAAMLVLPALEALTVALLALSLTLPAGGAGVPIPRSFLAVGGASLFIWMGIPASGVRASDGTTLVAQPPGRQQREQCGASWWAHRTPVPNRILSLQPAVYVGKLSYTIYLFHWPVLVLCRWTVGLDSAHVVGAALALTALLAMATYHLIEGRGTRVWRPRRTWHVFA